jgi:hypothetical protein
LGALKKARPNAPDTGLDRLTVAITVTIPGKEKLRMAFGGADFTGWLALGLQCWLWNPV